MTVRVIDIETTGTDPTVDAIIEIASVDLLKDGTIANQRTALVRPPLPVPPEASAVHHLIDEVLGAFAGRFEAAYAAGLRRKLGLFQERQDDGALAQDLLDRMAGNGADFTLTFRRLSDAAVSTDGDAAVRSLFTDPTAYDGWTTTWRRRLADDGEASGERRAAAMRAVNPAFIPRNHLDEEALSAAVNNGDLAAFEKLLAVLSAVVTANRPGAVGRSPWALWTPPPFGRACTRVKLVEFVLASPTRCRFCRPN